MARERAGTERGENPDHDEDVVVRQYRYLLTTATVDALEGIHVEVVSSMTRAQRSSLLRALSDAFATGQHVSVDDVARIAHLVATGAHRAPQVWIDSLARMGSASARGMAQTVLESEASFGRFNGYVYWDGSSPEPAQDAGPNDGFDPHPKGIRGTTDPRIYRYGPLGV